MGLKTPIREVGGLILGVKVEYYSNILVTKGRCHNRVVGGNIVLIFLSLKADVTME